MATPRKWLTAAAVATAAAVSDVPLTPAQEKYMEEVREMAAKASQAAEGELLQEFSKADFWMTVRMPGWPKMPVMEPQLLLQRVKANLDVLEWTHNFGLSPASELIHPGSLAEDTASIDKFGHIPSGWEMKVTGSPLVANTSRNEWSVMDAAETGLYRLPTFSDFDNITLEEASQRPTYFAGNLRRLDTGVERYGPLVAVLRGDVARDRALLIGSDTGGWTSVCNKSVTPVVSANWFQKLMFRCEPVTDVPLGVAEHQMHTLLSNTRAFSRVSGSLAHVVYQLLMPDAPVRPLEGNMYTEAALLGPVRTGDFKLIVASFASHFGTEQGRELREFCKHHKVPLAWGFGTGLAQPEAESQFDFLPWQPFKHRPAGSPRLLDPWAGWSATNVSFAGGLKEEAAWEKMWLEVSAARMALKPKTPPRMFYERLWNHLTEASIPVPPLRAGDCASPDRCFGVVTKNDAKDCVCRQDEVAAAIMV